MNSRPPKSGNDNGGAKPPPSVTDHRAFLPDGVANTGAAEAALSASGVAARTPPRAAVATDFQSLRRGQTEPRRFQKRTITDWLIDILTPVMIFVMVYSVIYFLLDVRYVYLDLDKVDRFAALYNTTIRWVALFFVVGVVALNRLIARDGRQESVIYIIGLALAIALYTLTTTQAVGSVARNFMNEPVIATGFNMMLVAFIWWLTNRLTHECCVDENPSAGDIGILTGTARRLRDAMAGKSATPAAALPPKPKPAAKKNDSVLYSMYGNLEAIDPATLGERKKAPAPPPPAATKRLPKRHPGISIFYTSIPTMFIFAIGQRVLITGGVEFARNGHYFILAYTLAALMLLMLSSLGGLREYFRERRITIPAGIGPFWIGLGSLMILFVLLASARMPSPTLPRAIASNPQHMLQSDGNDNGDAGGGKDKGDAEGGKEKDSQRDALQQQDRQSQSKENDKAQSQRDSQQQSSSDKAQSQKDGQQQQSSSDKNQSQNARQNARSQSARAQQPKPPALPPMPQIDAGPVMKVIEYIVIGAMALFGIYALIRLLGALALAVANRSGRGSFFGRLFGALDRLFQRLGRLPELPHWRPRPHIQRAIALLTRFTNPLNNPQLTPRQKVEYSYAALCALAEDLAVPKPKDQTPYEFIRSFPETLSTLEEDAMELTNAYVVSAYSNQPLDDTMLNVVRKFWRTYENVRRHVIR